MPQAQQIPPASITPLTPREGVRLQVNNESYVHTGDARMPLLWYLRDVLRLTGCKYGCDKGECGACTVLVDGRRALACQRPMHTLEGRHVTTVEGLAESVDALHPLQQAWIAEDAVLCGYCQPGWLMAAADLIARKPHPSDADIDALPNLCRCGSQPRVRAAIHRAAAAMRKDKHR
ncbi:MAG TPA: (2Fe-2S)-binding protein [Rhodanobacteraceae bacterium]